MTDSDANSDLILFINGKKYQLNQHQIDPKWNLLQFLRKSGLTGTKLGCGEGGCGACTVMLSTYDAELHSPVHISANACLTPLCALDGVAVTTVEGIGGMKQGLHPVQKRLADMHGSQCGFCTPGIVMAIYAHLRSHPNSTPHEIEESLDGNLCRCTGYRPIIDAARSLSNNKTSAVALRAPCCGGGSCGSGSCGSRSNCNGAGVVSSDSGEKKSCGEGCACAAASRAQKVIGCDAEDFVHSTSDSVLAKLPSLNEEMHARGLSEPIFPPALVHFQARRLKLESCGVTWFQPLTLEQLLELKMTHPTARLVVGNTEVGIETKFKGMEYPVLINPSRVNELNVLEIGSRQEPASGPAGINVGAAVSINRLRSYIHSLQEQFAQTSESYKLRGLVAIRDMLSWFASNHIRNVACVGGNIVTASPISDLNPMLMSCGAVLTVVSTTRGSRRVPISEFFLAYRKVNLQPDEVLQTVFIPFCVSHLEFVLPFKQARRREDDISIVTAGVRLRLEPLALPPPATATPATATATPAEDQGRGLDNGWTVVDCAMAYGGMAPTTVLAPNTANALIGRLWSLDSIKSVFSYLRSEMNLPDNVPGGQAEFRMALSVSFLLKSYLTITTELSKTGPLTPAQSLSADEESGQFNFLTSSKAYTRGEQGYVKRKATALPAPTVSTTTTATTSAAVGQAGAHKNADMQVSGETKYTEDVAVAMRAMTAHACLLISTKPHARILSVDTSAAEQCQGFIAYYNASDVTGCNNIGAIIKDEEVFATEFVTSCGQPIGVVIADSHEHAVYAMRAITVQYEELPAVISIQDAIKAKSFFPDHHVLKDGNIEQCKAQAEVHVEGWGRIGAQEHFYLETNATLAIPHEGGRLEIIASTQACTKTQNSVASVCGLPASKVVAKCQRMGGGFGGKETRTVFISCAAALAAQLLDRPVSILIERDVDMCVSGQRHSFEFNYAAGCNKNGALRYLQIQLYANAGCTLDLSLPVVDRALLHVDNCYRWPALYTRGSVCRTHQPSHTAFRGFGAPQGMAAVEMIIEHLAHKAGLQASSIRERNLYKEGDRTHFGQRLVDFYVPSLLEKLMLLADVPSRKAAVEEFNRNNKWRKRGIVVIPTKFGINFTAKFMNQGGALVHVYVDGSVLIAHGGTEMGQGLHTKVIQVAAQTFGIPDDFIIITETSTSTVANTSPTAASASTDLYGMAVLRACEEIAARLKPLRGKMPTDTDWKTLVNAAFFERIDLSAHGFYAIDSERCGFDWNKDCEDNAERGMPFNYFTQGVACTEVEIDTLTGDSQVVRADVLMDVGESINPAIDIGQIEGAYVQGFGWSTMEEMMWGDAAHPWVRPGQLFTRGPGTYKIPAFNDVPVDFRVHLSHTHNRFAVHSSKAVGEPPFFLGASAFFAIQEAVSAARRDNGYADTYYPLDMPATSERIRMACGDPIAALCCSKIDTAVTATTATPSTAAVTSTTTTTAAEFKPKGSW